jgi:hypothetical protein
LEGFTALSSRTRLAAEKPGMTAGFVGLNWEFAFSVWRQAAAIYCGVLTNKTPQVPFPFYNTTIDRATCGNLQPRAKDYGFPADDALYDQQRSPSALIPTQD